MTTTNHITLGRCLRPALLALLSATLLIACGGGGDGDGEEHDATGATDSGATPTVNVEREQAHALRSPMGGFRRAPICLDSPQACPPNLPPTH